MDVQRYIVVNAVKTKNNELIHVWDARLTFKDMEDYGGQITVSDSKERLCNFVECVFDLETKEI